MDKEDGRTKRGKTIITQPVPAFFADLLDEEQDKMGCFTRVECLGRILQQHFGVGPTNRPEPIIEKKTDGGIFL